MLVRHPGFSVQILIPLRRKRRREFKPHMHLETTGKKKCSIHMTEVAHQAVSICQQAWVKQEHWAGSMIGTYRHGQDLNIWWGLALRNIYTYIDTYI